MNLISPLKVFEQKEEQKEMISFQENESQRFTIDKENSRGLVAEASEKPRRIGMIFQTTPPLQSSYGHSHVEKEDKAFHAQHITKTLSSVDSKETTLWREFIIKNARDLESGMPEFEKIKQLDLSGRSLKILPEGISLMSNLLHIDLSSNELTEFPAELLNLKKLKVIKLRGNHLTTLPVSILEIKSLNKVDILNNPIREVSATLSPIVRDLPYMAHWN